MDLIGSLDLENAEGRGRALTYADLRSIGCPERGSACAVVLCAGTEANAIIAGFRIWSLFALASVPAQRTSIRSSSSVFTRVVRVVLVEIKIRISATL